MSETPDVYEGLGPEGLAFDALHHFCERYSGMGGPLVLELLSKPMGKGEKVPRPPRYLDQNTSIPVLYGSLLVHPRIDGDANPERSGMLYDMAIYRGPANSVCLDLSREGIPEVETYFVRDPVNVDIARAPRGRKLDKFDHSLLLLQDMKSAGMFNPIRWHSAKLVRGGAEHNNAYTAVDGVDGRSPLLADLSKALLLDPSKLMPAFRMAAADASDVTYKLALIGLTTPRGPGGAEPGAGPTPAA